MVEMAPAGAEDCGFVPSISFHSAASRRLPSKLPVAGRAGPADGSQAWLEWCAVCRRGKGEGKRPIPGSQRSISLLKPVFAFCAQLGGAAKQAQLSSASLVCREATLRTSAIRLRPPSRPPPESSAETSEQVQSLTTQWSIPASLPALRAVQGHQCPTTSGVQQGSVFPKEEHRHKPQGRAEERHPVEISLFCLTDLHT